MDRVSAQLVNYGLASKPGSRIKIHIDNGSEGVKGGQRDAYITPDEALKLMHEITVALLELKEERKAKEAANANP